MRDTSKFHEAFTTNKTERKIRGRHTGASPAVLSKLRFGVSRSDRSSFLNVKSIKMRDTIDESCNPEQHLTAEQIIYDFLQTADINTHIENLNDFFVAFVLYHDCPRKEWKDSMVFTYKSIRDLMNTIKGLGME